MPHLNLEILKDPPQSTEKSQPKPQLMNPTEVIPSKDLVSNLLKEAGIGKGVRKKSIKELLTEYDIDSEAAVELLAGIAHRGESDAIRLRAIDTALKLGGDLVETTQIPSVTIVINDKDSKFEVNPILIPRAS